MRHLLYVADTYPTLTQTFTLREVRDLHAHGLPVTVVALHGPGPADPPRDALRDPAVIDLPRVLSPALAWAVVAAAFRHPLRVARLLARIALPHSSPFRLDFHLRAPLHFAWGCWLSRHVGSEDHLHAQFLYAGSTVAWVAAVLADASLSFTSHSDHGLLLAGPKLRRSRRALAISEFEKRRLLEHDPGVPSERVVVHHLGVDIPPAAPPAPSQPPFRVVAVGALGPKKGHDVLIRAIARLPESLDARLEIVGSGGERERLENLIAELGVGDRVRLRGALDHGATLELVEGAHVVALACRVTDRGDFDGIPIALMEGMARARPVVSCRVSGIPELVTDGESGFLVEAEDDAALADRLRRLADDPSLRERMGAAAHARVRADFDASASDERARRIFRELIE